nr:unnamed protein product [Digitaria exilis]
MRRHLDHTFTPGHRQAWEQQPWVCSCAGCSSSPALAWLRQPVLLAGREPRMPHLDRTFSPGRRQAATSARGPGRQPVAAVCRPQLSRAAREPVAQRRKDSRERREGEKRSSSTREEQEQLAGASRGGEQAHAAGAARNRREPGTGGPGRRVAGEDAGEIGTESTRNPPTIY